MRVLLATFSYLPNTTGIDRYIRILEKGLRSLSHQVDILALEPGRHTISLSGEELGGDVSRLRRQVRAGVDRFYRRRVPGAEPWVVLREAERYFFELSLALCDLTRYDVLHAQDTTAARALARLRLPGQPLVASLHAYRAGRSRLDKGPRQQVRRVTRYLELEEKLGASAPDRVLFPSLWLMTLFSDHYVLDPQSLRHVPYGLDLDDFRLSGLPRPPEAEAANGRKVLLCPARLAPEKGQTHLLATLALLAKRRRDFVCWFAGDGPSRAALEAEARRLRLKERAVFLGSRTDMPALMAAADVVVVPSVQDNLPFVVMEAQAAGKAVVASRTGGIPEMVDGGRSGLLVSPGDEHELAGALALLLDNPDLTSSLGRQARIRAARRWDGARMVSDILGIYQEMIGGRYLDPG
ncbi:MAG: glycosyltransferase family 4 protein [Bacillota bacterium]